MHLPKALLVVMLLLDRARVASMLLPIQHRTRQRYRLTFLGSSSPVNAIPDEPPASRPLLLTPASPNNDSDSNSSSLQQLTDQILAGHPLDPSDYFLVLASWCNTCTESGAEMVESLLEKLPSDQLTSRLCSLAVEAWSKAGQVQKARESLQWMHELAQEHPHLAPARIAYKYLLEAHLRLSQLDEARALLAEMEASPESLQHPVTHDYNLLLFAHARIGAASDCEILLKHMVDRCKELDNNDASQPKLSHRCPCAPDTYSYYFLLDAHARSNQPGAGQRAMEILAQLDALADSRPDYEARPDARMYTAVILAIARTNPSIQQTVELVEGLFAQAKAKGVVPDKYMYNAVLDVHANNDAPGSAERAEEILREITAEGIASDVAYNTLLKAWKSSRHPDACERSLAILKFMEEHQFATTVSYTTVIGALAIKGTKASAQYAHEILENMQREYRSGNLDVQPDQQTYNSLLNAWVRCGEPARAERILRMMEHNTNDTAISAPSVISYSTVMSGWAKSKQPYAWKRAENILARMIARHKATGEEDLVPNAFSYVSLINAYANSGDPQAVQEAEDTLKWMYKEYKAGRRDLKPNTKIVTRVIDAYKNSGREDAGQKAEAMLDWLLEKHALTKDDDFAPNGYTFSAVIAAWARSRKFEKALRVRRILVRMVELHEAGTISARPNVALYTAVIYTCGFCADDSIEKASSLRVAIETYNELRQPMFPYGAPNNVTYMSMLTVLKNLLPPGKERSAAALAVFNTAKDNGFVDQKVIRRLSSIVSAKELQGVIPENLVNGHASLKQIPSEWCRQIWQ